MKARILIDVPDDFIAQRVAEIVADLADDGAEREWIARVQANPAVFLRERLEAVAEDELAIALWQWPIETSVELGAEHEYMIERAGVQASAIGMARLSLQKGEPEDALATLDKACEALHRTHWDACLADGHPAEKVELLLGPRERAS